MSLYYSSRVSFYYTTIQMLAKFFSLCDKCLRSTGFHITLLVGLNVLTYLDWRGFLEARNRLGGKWTLY